MRETRSNGPIPSPSPVASPDTVENDLTFWSVPFSLTVPIQQIPDCFSEAIERDAMPDSDAPEEKLADLDYVS